MVKDDDDERPTFPVFNPKTNMVDLKFLLGMLFKDHKEFKEAVKSYSIKNGKEVKFFKNESWRVKSVCKKDAHGQYMHLRCKIPQPCKSRHLLMTHV